MQYWLNEKTNKMERLEEVDFKKRPELTDFLLSQGYVRIVSESDHKPYKKALKKESIKKAVKKVAKKVTKKKK